MHFLLIYAYPAEYKQLSNFNQLHTDYKKPVLFLQQVTVVISKTLIYLNNFIKSYSWVVLEVYMQVGLILLLVFLVILSLTSGHWHPWRRFHPRCCSSMADKVSFSCENSLKVKLTCEPGAAIWKPSFVHLSSLAHHIVHVNTRLWPLFFLRIEKCSEELGKTRPSLPLRQQTGLVRTSKKLKQISQPQHSSPVRQPSVCADSNGPSVSPREPQGQREPIQTG